MPFEVNCCLKTTQPQKSLDWFRGCVKMVTLCGELYEYKCLP